MGVEHGSGGEGGWISQWVGGEGEHGSGGEG